jgi:hypothetical protein
VVSAPRDAGAFHRRQRYNREHNNKLEALMRVLSMLLVSIAFTLPVFSEVRAARSGAAIVGTGTVTFAEIAGKSPPAGGRGRDAVSSHAATEKSEINLVFPVLGTAGAFKTELVLVNRVPRAQFVDAYYFPAGGGVVNCAALPVRIRLEAQTAHYFVDFIGEVFKTEGVGSLVLYSVLESGGPDFTAQIDGNARIWSPAAGGGAASQTFSALTLDAASGSNSAFGLRSDASFRTNWGIFNADTRNQNFNLTFEGSGVSERRTVTVPACSLVQDLVPGGPYGPLLIRFERNDNGGNFYSYGSSVDRVSGDAWNVPGRK